jgi:hypothetical protein
MIINFQKVEDTNIAYKGKYIRLRNPVPVRLQSILSGDFVLQPNSIGLCYEVRGITVFVAFNEKGTPPNKSILTFGISRLKHHIQIYPHSDTKWEIER